MRNNLPTISKKLEEKQGREDFVILITKWQSDGLSIILGYVWKGLDLLRENVISRIDFNTEEEAQIERDLTENLVIEIIEILPREIPFYILHSPNEMNTLQSRQAKPSEYDFAFYWRAKRTIKFPFETKVLRVKNQKVDMGDYIDTINSRFITGIYAPNSSHVAMLGYLVFQENLKEILKFIDGKIVSPTEDNPDFPDKFHKVSFHERHSGITPTFYCHHMMYPIKRSPKIQVYT